MPNAAVEQLRAALRVSPNNVPLRVALAELLLSIGQPAEAEREFREAAKLKPDDVDVKTGLAHAFFAQGKEGETLSIIESFAGNLSPRLRLLYARVLEHTDKPEQARRQYDRAVEEDETLKDDAFDQSLPNRPKPTTPGEAAEPDQELAPRQTWEGDDERPVVEVEKPTINFDNVGGLDPVKEEIRLKIVHPLKFPDLYKAYGKTIGGGILMYGPPGCGKTFLARATAGEVKASFISVGINDVLDMWIGSSEKNLHGLFKLARAKKPCVLFFDEVDALAASRSDMRTSAGRHLINQFLSELDGVKHSNEGVLILAATNAPWHVDAAFRRPGRFDRVLFVPPPDAPGRSAILQTMLVGKPIDKIDYDAVAKKTPNFSGADLKAVIDLTIEAKLRGSMQSGAPTPITTKDLLAAAASVKPSTREWFNSARNYALYSNEAGTYDEIIKYLKM